MYACNFGAPYKSEHSPRGLPDLRSSSHPWARLPVYVSTACRPGSVPTRCKSDVVIKADNPARGIMSPPGSRRTSYGRLSPGDPASHFAELGLEWCGATLKVQPLGLSDEALSNAISPLGHSNFIEAVYRLPE